MRVGLWECKARNNPRINIKRHQALYSKYDSLAKSSFSHASLLAVGHKSLGRHPHEGEVGRKSHGSPNAGRIAGTRKNLKKEQTDHGQLYRDIETGRLC